MWSSFRTWQDNRKELGIVLALLASAFLLRSASFLQTFIDWDEGLYFLIGEAILDGYPPYTVIWDHKPPGLFLVYALTQLIFGQDVLGMRIVGWLAVSFSAYVLYRMGRDVSGRRGIGLLAGVFYLVFSLNSQGLAANAEILFTPFVVLSFWLVLFQWRERRRLWEHTAARSLAVGLLMGLAFEVKYIVIFELTAIILLLGIKGYQETLPKEGAKTAVVRTFSNYILLAIGFLLPFVLVAIYYWRSGNLDIYFQSNFAANLAYGGNDFSLLAFLESLRHQLARNTLLWLGLLLSPIYLYVFRREMSAGERRHILAVLLWFLLTLPALVITRQFYSHYYLQIMPPMCLLSAWLIMKLLGTAEDWSDRRKYMLALGLVVIAPLLLTAAAPLGRGLAYAIVRSVGDDRYWGDDTAKIAAYLSEKVTSDDYIYAIDYPPIIYYLVPAKIPTRYPFALHLMEESYSTVIDVEQKEEVAQIMSKRPAYLIKQYEDDSPYYRAFDSHLAKDYKVEWVLNGVELYVRRDDRG